MPKCVPGRLIGVATNRPAGRTWTRFGHPATAECQGRDRLRPGWCPRRNRPSGLCTRKRFPSPPDRSSLPGRCASTRSRPRTEQEPPTPDQDAATTALPRRSQTDATEIPRRRKAWGDGYQACKGRREQGSPTPQPISRPNSATSVGPHVENGVHLQSGNWAVRDARGRCERAVSDNPGRCLRQRSRASETRADGAPAVSASRWVGHRGSLTGAVTNRESGRGRAITA